MEILLLVVDTIAVLIPAFYVASQCFPQQILKILLFTSAIVLVLITSLELMLGSLSILNNTTLLLGSIATGGGIFFYFKTYPLASTSDSLNVIPEEQPSRLNKRGILAIIFLATTFSVPIQAFLIEYGFQIHRIHPLTSWDVVTYHLPNAIDYLQTGSLWTMRGSFSQYPGGNELLNIWSFISIKTDALLGFNNLVFNGTIVLFLLLCLKNLGIFQRAFYYWLSGIAIVICLFLQPDYQRMIFSFGQNDLALACVEILALWILVEGLKSPILIRYWFMLGAMLGIGIGIKPNGIYYFVGFIVLIVYALWGQRTLTGYKILKTIAFVSTIAFLFGGFWYIRNLITFGSIFESSILDAGFPGAIVNHLFNPNFYVLDQTNLTLVIILVINCAGWLVLFLSPSLQKSPLILLLFFNLIAFLSFIFTPHSSGYWAGNQWIFKTQLRYGITLLPVTIIVSIVLVRQCIKILLPLPYQAQWDKLIISFHLSREQTVAEISKTKTITIIRKVTIAILLICLLQGLTYSHPIGLPNFEAVLFARNANSPLSKVYSWVQDNISNQTIYTIGLRPYGLYNFPFRNRVIYGGDSDQWTYVDALDVLENDRPDFFALSRNPFNGKFPVALKEMLDHPTQFELMYGDGLAVIFKTQNP